MLKKPAKMVVVPFPKLSIKTRLSTILLRWLRTMFGKESTLKRQTREQNEPLSSGKGCPLSKGHCNVFCFKLIGMSYPQMYHLKSSLRRTSPNIGSVVSDITLTSVPFSLRAPSSSVQRAAITQDDETAIVTAGTLP